MYKLNCCINNYIGFDKITWEPIKNDINYTVLDNNRLKISQLGKFPLFPTEAVDMLRFSITIDRNALSNFVQNASIELTLLFGNKTDTCSFSIKDHLDN